MVRKGCYLYFRGPQGGSKGGAGGQKYKYGSKCLKLPNSSRNVGKVGPKTVPFNPFDPKYHFLIVEGRADRGSIREVSCCFSSRSSSHS